MSDDGTGRDEADDPERADADRGDDIGDSSGVDRSGDHADDGGSLLAGIDTAMRGQFGWYSVAKKEFRDTVRSKLLWLLSAVFVGVFALPVLLGLVVGFGPNVSRITTDQFFQQRSTIVSGLVPIVAIAVGYAAVGGERESGSLKVLLSLPYDRRDVVTGKVVGRSAVVAVPILVGYVLSAAVLATVGAQLSVLGFVVGSLLTALLGVVFTGLAVGASAATSTTRRAMVWAVGVYVYLVLFWGSFASSAGGLLREYAGAAVDTSLQVSLFLQLLDPTRGYGTLVDSALGQSTIAARAGMVQGPQRVAAYCQQALGGDLSMGGAGGFTCQPGAGGVPIYFSDAAVLLYMLLWLAVPLLIGYRLFGTADL